MLKVCYSDHLESLQGLQHLSVLEKTDLCSSRFCQHPLRTSFWAVSGGFPAVLVMCAAGDGGHATLILLPSSGKYPASLCRTKTTKSWVWLQPPGFSAPTRTCPRVTACCFLLPIYPCMTLLSHAFSLWPSFQPMKDIADYNVICLRFIPETEDFRRSKGRKHRTLQKRKRMWSGWVSYRKELFLFVLHNSKWLYNYSEIVFDPEWKHTENIETKLRLNIMSPKLKKIKLLD